MNDKTYIDLSKIKKSVFILIFVILICSCNSPINRTIEDTISVEKINENYFDSVKANQIEVAHECLKKNNQIENNQIKIDTCLPYNRIEMPLILKAYQDYTGNRLTKLDSIYSKKNNSEGNSEDCGNWTYDESIDFDSINNYLGIFTSENEIGCGRSFNHVYEYKTFKYNEKIILLYNFVEWTQAIFTMNYILAYEYDTVLRKLSQDTIMTKIFEALNSDFYVNNLSDSIPEVWFPVNSLNCDSGIIALSLLVNIRWNRIREDENIKGDRVNFTIKNGQLKKSEPYFLD